MEDSYSGSGLSRSLCGSIEVDTSDLCTGSSSKGRRLRAVETASPGENGKVTGDWCITGSFLPFFAIFSLNTFLNWAFKSCVEHGLCLIKLRSFGPACTSGALSPSVARCSQISTSRAILLFAYLYFRSRLLFFLISSSRRFFSSTTGSTYPYINTFNSFISSFGGGT